MKRRSENLSQADVITATNISPRKLERWRQQGLVPIVRQHPRGLGRGRGSIPHEYPPSAIPTIRRLVELHRQFKKKEECRWRLFCERYPVRIARDLADTLDQYRALAKQMKSAEDVATKLLPHVKSAYRRRGNPLRVIFPDLSGDDLLSAATLVICVVLGIRLPLFDEPNPYPFQVFKRAFGLPKEWPLPPGLFDVFSCMHEQIHNALLTASADELQAATAACRLLSSIFDNPENSRRGAIVVAGAPLPWRLIKLFSLIWPLPAVRAATVGLVIFGIRGFKSALGDEAVAAFASIASGMSITWSEP